MPALTTRLRRALPRVTRRRVVAGSVVVVLLAALVGWAAMPERHSWTAVDQRLTVLSGPSGTEPVDLDTRCCSGTASAAPRTR
jgi:ABC-2 type transport system ATP-binding protein